VPPFQLSLLSPQIGGGDGRAGWNAWPTGHQPSGSPLSGSLGTAITASSRACIGFSRARRGFVRVISALGLNLLGLAVAPARTPRASIGSHWSWAPPVGPFHATAEDGVLFKAIAEVIGRRLNIPVVSKSPEEAAEHFGWFAMFAGHRRPDLERADPLTARLATQTAGAHRRYRSSGVFRSVAPRTDCRVL